jgi:hypothetical protein
MSIEWDIDLSGFDILEEELRARIPIAVGRAAEYIKSEAVPLTPIEEGDLRGSAGVVVHGNTGIIEYHSVYARYQHYGLDFVHPRGGQALFLETPMVTKTAEVAKIISDTIWGPE